jgi:hypothetical protein
LPDQTFAEQERERKLRAYLPAFGKAVSSGNFDRAETWARLSFMAWEDAATDVRVVEPQDAERREDA